MISKLSLCNFMGLWVSYMSISGSTKKGESPICPLYVP